MPTEKKERSLFATRLRQLRKYSGMTQEEIAKHLKLDRSTYTYYETDKCRPDFGTLLRIASIYHASTDFLLGRTDEIGGLQPILREPQDTFNARFEGAESLSLLPQDERAFLVAYRQLSEEQREEVLGYMLSFWQAEQKERDDGPAEK